MSTAKDPLGYWVERVNTFVRGCPPDFVYAALCEAAREVCAETNIWKEEVRVDVPSGTAVVEITPFLPDYVSGFASALSHTILSAAVDGRRLTLLMHDAAQFARPDSARTGFGDIVAVAARDADTIELFPAPDKDTVVVLRVACVPTTLGGSVWLPEHVATAAYDAIVCAALAKLFVVKDTPWSDPELAAYHARKAVHEKAKLRTRNETGAVAGSLMTRMQPFGA